MILLYCIGLFLCFYLLAKVCEDYFVESLDVISKKLKLPEDVAGATLMAMGSSAPELFTAIIALTKVGAENVGAGTIVGSAIFNVLVIVGASAAVATAYLDWRPVLRDLLFYIVSILLLMFTFWDGRITMAEAGLYVVAYAIYIYILARWRHWFPQSIMKRVARLLKDEVHHLEDAAVHIEEAVRPRRVKAPGIVHRVLDSIFPNLTEHPPSYISVFLLSILFIGALSWCLVELAVLLAHSLGVSEVLIALTVLAAGTSVPDLLSSIIVARQGKGGMAVSNAVGSNTFDILIGLGLPWLGYTLYKGSDVVVSTENLISSMFLLFATVIALLFLLSVQHFKIGLKSGYLLLMLYAAYVGYAIYMALHPNAITIEMLVGSIL